ncbi:uncharacterized protein LOC123015681 [Tribolium madens]|uniref:uncharacterized protein LOC123015681 n=1 Tax=Tribolium madens TaxID=41895 RepID=UPI001CF73B78|nr:uncharacterized protein LOC123015681 [Tribolium madens]
MHWFPFLLLLLIGGASCDDYVDEVQGQCYSNPKSSSCAKYQFVKYIDDYRPHEWSLTREVKLISIPGANVSAIHAGRYLETDTEGVKLFKYLKRRVAKFVREQGLAVDLPEGSQVVDVDTVGSGRKKKEKKQIILPILILIKLFKVKILVTLALAGIIFIKKMLLVAAFVLPAVVASIKAHCKAQQFHVVPYNVHEDHYTHDHEHDDDGYAISSYGSDDKHFWDKKRYSFL